MFSGGSTGRRKRGEKSAVRIERSKGGVCNRGPDALDCCSVGEEIGEVLPAATADFRCLT